MSFQAETAKIGLPSAALGATLNSGGLALFLDHLGAHRTLDLIYTGRLMSRAEAVAPGLFSRVLPDDEVVQAADAAASNAARGATRVFLESKRLIARIRDERLSLWDSVDIENAAQAGSAIPTTTARVSPPSSRSASLSSAGAEAASRRLLAPPRAGKEPDVDSEAS